MLLKVSFLLVLESQLHFLCITPLYHIPVIAVTGQCVYPALGLETPLLPPLIRDNMVCRRHF